MEASHSQDSSSSVLASAAEKTEESTFNLLSEALTGTLQHDGVERALGSILGFLDYEVFDLVTNVVQHRRLDPGEVLFSPTVTFRHTAILISGRVNISCIESGELHLLHEVKPGRVITSLFTIINELVNGHLASKANDRFTRPAKIQALATDPTVVAVIPEGFFSLLLESHQAAATQILSLFVSRVCKITLPFIHRYLEYSHELLNIVHASDVIAPGDLAYSKFCAVLHSSSPSVDQQSHLDFSSVDASTAEKVTVQRACLSLMASSLGLSTTQFPQHAANAVELHSFDTGYELVKENFLFEGLFLVLDGTVEAVSTPKRPGQQIISFWELGRGSLAGALSAIIFQPSPVCWRAKTPVRLAFLRNSVYLKVADSNPILLRNLMRQFLVNVGFCTLAFDYATEWRRYWAGSTIVEQNTKANEVFKVVSGRIRTCMNSVHQSEAVNQLQVDAYRNEEIATRVAGDHGAVPPNGLWRQMTKVSLPFVSPFSKRTATLIAPIKSSRTPEASGIDVSTSITSERGYGETLGELPVLTDGEYEETCTALRDTHMATLPRSFIQTIVFLFPQMSRTISRIVAQTLTEKKNTDSRYPEQSGFGSVFGDPSSTCNIIAIVPISKKVPVAEFTLKLSEGFASEGAETSTLTEKEGGELMGSQLLANSSELRLQAWLINKEHRGTYVLMLADGTPNSEWTKQCVKQSDIILFIAFGDYGRFEIGEFENSLRPESLAVRKVLVLLHRAREVVPGSTKEYLLRRPWIARHLHVLIDTLPNISDDSSMYSVSPKSRTLLLRMLTRLETLHVSNKPTSRLWDISSAPNSEALAADRRSDFSRLARMMMNKAIGIVFAGGGAKGSAHIGVLRALESCGIKADFFGGTSIGACVGALYAKSGNLVEVDAKMRYVFTRLASIERVFDLTLPFTSLTRGKLFNDTLKKVLDFELDIEDLWFPFFCNAIDISNFEHRLLHGGVAWRRVRASMSLMGLVPPVPDGDGHLLVDGGYYDNLPATAMKAFGAAYVIAIDAVAADFDKRPVEHDIIELSGWRAAFLGQPRNKTTHRPIPSMLELQNRMMFFTQQQRGNTPKNMHNGGN
ncbi:phosphatidylcholine and lysophosphatidylcholine phospholipase [Gonapodya sp. JEL0774]|nr:phosphatidylcholine and lysophosphatidylcholine phospholipase [Gonapodya sp. JEL0774]